MAENEWSLLSRNLDKEIWNDPLILESGSRYALIPVCYSGNIILFDTALEAIEARKRTKQFRCEDPSCTHQFILDLFKIN